MMAVLSLQTGWTGRAQSFFLWVLSFKDLSWKRSHMKVLLFSWQATGSQRKELKHQSSTQPPFRNSGSVTPSLLNCQSKVYSQSQSHWDKVPVGKYVEVTWQRPQENDPIKGRSIYFGITIGWNTPSPPPPPPKKSAGVFIFYWETGSLQRPSIKLNEVISVCLNPVGLCSYLKKKRQLEGRNTDIGSTSCENFLRQKSGWCSYKPRKAEDCQKNHRELEGRQGSVWASWSQTHSLQSWKTIHFCCSATLLGPLLSNTGMIMWFTTNHQAKSEFLNSCPIQVCPSQAVAADPTKRNLPLPFLFSPLDSPTLEASETVGLPVYTEAGRNLLFPDHSESRLGYRDGQADYWSEITVCDCKWPDVCDIW